MKNFNDILLVTKIFIFFGLSTLMAQNTSVYVAAHADDWQLFMNPNAYISLKVANDKVIFIHTTAGDGGNGVGNNYYLAREEGSLRAIRFMSNTFASGAGLGSNMSPIVANINGHPILKYTYRNAVAYFLRLPDGNLYGEGYPAHNYNSLKKIYDGTITSISAIDGSTTYNSLTDLQDTIKQIITNESNPSGSITFNIADTNLSINPDDHSDHISSSYIMQNVANTIGGVTMNLYSEYVTAGMSQNVFGDNFMVDVGTWAATASGISDNFFSSTWDNTHNSWLGKQYYRSITSGGIQIATINASDPNAAENPLDTGTFTVNLNTVNTGSSITINYTVSGTATSGSDYTALPGSVVIPNGAQSATIVLTPINDSEVEIDETVILTLNSGIGYIVGSPQSAVVTITSEDVQPSNYSVTVVATDPNAAENPLDTGSFTMNLSEVNIGSALTINYTISGTATSGIDYTALPGTVVIPNGAQSVSITLTPIDDIDVEIAETVILMVSGGTGYTVGTPQSATVTITSDDVAPPGYTVTVVASDPNAAENPLDTGKFTVSLNEVNNGTVLTINYTVSGTATSGSDYTALPGTVVIPNGAQSAVITLTPIDDILVEASESVILTLSSGTKYVIGTPQSATITITSEDIAPPVNIALNKPTSASSSKERPSSRAVDGIYSLSNWWGTNPYPAWWQVDLNAAFDISKVVVFNYYDGTRYYQYDIQYSLNGSNWTTLVDFNSNTIPSTSQGNTFIINNTSARYLRVNMNFNSANVGVHIIEFEAYGVPSNTVRSSENNHFLNSSEKNSVLENDKNPLKIYPNPVKTEDDLKMSINLQNEENALVEVFNILGTRIISQKYPLIKGVNEIEFSEYQLAAGMYLFKVSINEGVWFRKVFIE